MAINGVEQPTRKNQLGWFAGVFTPAILTILGVIMFMRAGFVVGHGGVLGAFSILLTAKAITLTTSFSIGAISSNIKVRGGGSYFLISRVLGVEFGGAIGIALFFALSLAVPFYILGFTEALTRSFPILQPHFQIITLSTALLVFAIAYFGAGWAMRAQFIIMLLVFASIFVFEAGALLHFSPTTFMDNFFAAPAVKGEVHFSYWALFAIYFPAVTGIDAGVNMSGDLKNPGKSIPKGTFWALGVGFVVYASQIVVCGGAFQRSALIAQPYGVLRDNALFGLGFIVSLGVISATLSSALTSHLGAPRVLQAMSRDRIFNFLRPFARGSRKGDEPQRALFITLGVTIAVLLWAGNGADGGALNIIAAIISMFFLYGYGMINLAAFIEEFGDNPSFRPGLGSFHWSIALLGAGACTIVSLLIHWRAAAGAIVTLVVILWLIRRRHLRASFGDARRGFFYKSMRSNLLRLRRMPEDPKNWRPNILVFSGNPMARVELIRYGMWLESRRGIVYLANVLLGVIQELAGARKRGMHQLVKFCNQENIEAFPVVVAAPSIEQGISMILQATAIGPIYPNLALFGWSSKHQRHHAYVNELRTGATIGMSLVLVKHNGIVPPEQAKRIDIWWRGRKNGNLMLLLGFLLTENWEWSGATIRLLRAVEKEAAVIPARNALEQLVTEARVEASVEIITATTPFSTILQNYSHDASCVLLGFELPSKEDESTWHANYLNHLSQLPTTVLLVNSSEEEDLLV